MSAGNSNSNILLRRIIAVASLVLLVLGGLLIWQSSKASPRTESGETVVLPDSAFDPNSGREAEANKQQECPAGQLQITAITDKNSYGPEENPKLSLSVENTGSTQCYRNLGTSQMIFEIQSGTQTVWVSNHCQTDPDDRYVLLSPGQILTTEPLEWDRTASSEDSCDIEREPVIAGGASYHLLVAVGEIPAQESKQFLLH